MTISKDLFLSILALDSYNRGYDAGTGDGGENDPDGLGELGTIGSADIVTRAELEISDDAYEGWQDSSFYAIAYEIGADGPEGLANQTVISYRGTDQYGEFGWPWEWEPSTWLLDPRTGFGVGAGNIEASVGCAFMRTIPRHGAFRARGAPSAAPSQRHSIRPRGAHECAPYEYAQRPARMSRWTDE